MLWSILLTALAAPLAYEVQHTDERDTVRMSWRDREGASQSLDATLPSGVLESGADYPSDGPTRSAAIAERLRQQAQGAAAGLVVTSDAGGVQMKGPPAAVAWAREALPQVKAEVLAQMRLLRRDDGIVVHDIPQIALEAVPDLRPVSQGLGGMLQARPLAQRAMSMVQALHYEVGRDALFRSPAAVVREGKGDCDEKVALFVALMRAQEPTLRMAVVTTDTHAFVALDLHPHPGDQTVELLGTTLVAAEPVGPGQSPLGRLASKSRAALEAGAYRVWEVPMAGSPTPPPVAPSAEPPTEPPAAVPGVSLPCELVRTARSTGPVGLYGAASAGDDDGMWVVSGSAREATYGHTLWRYTPGDDRWAEVATSQPLVPRRYASASLVGDTLVVVGGYGPDGLSHQVERIDVSTGAVTLGAPLPERRYFHGAAVLGDTVWLAGGHATMGGGLLRTVLGYEPATDTWRSGPYLEEARDVELVAHGDTLYAMGGYGGDAEPASRRVEAWSPPTGTWTARTELPAATSAATAVVLGDAILSFGDYEAHGRVLHYDVPTERWAEPTVAYTPRRHATASVVGDRIVVFGGNVATSGSWSDTVEVYELRCP